MIYIGITMMRVMVGSNGLHLVRVEVVEKTGEDEGNT